MKGGVELHVIGDLPPPPSLTNSLQLKAKQRSQSTSQLFDSVQAFDQGTVHFLITVGKVIHVVESSLHVAE